MTEQNQQPEHTPVPGDLDKELAQARRGLPKVTVGLGVAVLVLAAFFGGVWTHSAVAGSGAPAAQQPQRQGGPRVFGPGQGPGGQGQGQGPGQGGPGGQGQGLGGQGQGQGGPGGQGPGQGGPGGMRGGGVTGTVDRVEGGTIYLKAPDGSEVKVTTSDTTKVETSQPGTLSDITPGSSVVVQGQRTENGVTATTITRHP